MSGCMGKSMQSKEIDRDEQKGRCKPVKLPEWIRTHLHRPRRAAEPLSTGEWGEECAAVFLREKGYRILGRRVRVGRRDEIDILARQGEVLVFVEVKTRRNEDFGRPMDSVDAGKRHALSRAAIRYVSRLRRVPCFRFDVVEVIGESGGDDPVLRHIERAFELDRRYVVPH
jgi:putative endonuclease